MTGTGDDAAGAEAGNEARPGVAGADEGTCISGAMLLGNFRAFAREVRPDCYDAAIATLPPEVAAQYHAIVPASWVPATVADVIFEAIATQARRPLEELFPTVVERGVERTLHTIWRALLRFTTDRAIMSIGPRIFRKTYNRGRLQAIFAAKGSAEVVLTQWPETPRFRLLATAAGIRTVLRLSGRKQPTVDIEPTPDGARFFARWG